MDPYGLAALGAAGIVAKKLFGRTLDEMGSDINKVYQQGRDRILMAATRKIENPDDGKVPNLRVARDVLWNGAVSESEVCAEYFGGVLASSRTGDGTDDASIHYVDVIKSLSSKQLHLHYCLYRALQCRLIESGGLLNPGLENDLRKATSYFDFHESLSIGLTIELDFPVLARTGLVASYEMNNEMLSGGRLIPYFSFSPTTFGVALYAIGLNRMNIWSKFASEDFGTFAGVQTLNLCVSSLSDLVKIVSGEALRAEGV